LPGKVADGGTFAEKHDAEQRTQNPDRRDRKLAPGENGRYNSDQANDKNPLPIGQGSDSQRKDQPVLQRDFFAGWAKAAALPTEKCSFTSAVGKIEPQQCRAAPQKGKLLKGIVQPDGEHEAKNRQSNETEDDYVVHCINSPV